MLIRRHTLIALALALPLAACGLSGDKDTDQAAGPAQEIALSSLPGDSARSMAEELSLRHLYEVEPALIEGVDGIWAMQVKLDELGMAHTRLQQTHDNIAVFGGEAIVHLNGDGSFRDMTDAFVRNIQVNTKPRLTDLEAIDLAVASEGGWDTISTKPEHELHIVRMDGVDHLTYRVALQQFEEWMEPAMPVVFIDAHTGEIVNRYNDLKTARNRRTYNGNNTTSLPGTLVLTETTGSTGDWVINQAHTNAGHTYDYYQAMHNRDSYNNNGATIHTTVHHRVNYVNAFWNGSQMVYGDGDGVQSGPLTVLDVVAHEFTHAVTGSTSRLIYQNESGALNEAMSDIFAAAVESWVDGNGTYLVSDDTWKVGEQCWTPHIEGDALRYMNDPQAGGHYDYWPTRYTGGQDNGGVHWNSGIANLAFYLLSEGGTHPRGTTTVEVPAIGIAKAAAIFYRANTVYLTSSSNFEHARTSTAQAALDLYSPAEAAAVHLTWDAVGVPGSPNLPATELERGQTVGNLSASTGNWIHFYIQVPDGASNFTASISGGSGDADLYVRFGSQPTTTSYDCRPYRNGNNETCTFAAPQVGNYYVALRAYSSFSGVSLNVNYAVDDAGYPGLELDEQNLSGSSGAWGQQYALEVPADATTLVVEISGGTGDADLYVRRGALPTTSSYDCRPYRNGNNETCTFTSNVGGHTWYIRLRGYSSYSGVRLTADYDK